jgi:molybdopterin molybdotransferase
LTKIAFKEGLMTADLISQPGCDADAQGVTSYTLARSLAEESVQPVRGHEILPLRSALGRVLAKALISPANVPPHRNSAMDGYALHSSALPQESAREFEVIGTAWAGNPYAGEPVQPGQCVRIMTGAKVPDDADCVVIQEQAETLAKNRIRIGSGHQGGQNIRYPGEDITLGQELMAVGKRLGPAELGLLASLGIGEVAVYRKVRVALISSGDELKPIGTPLADGQIYDSNRYTLFGMLSELGVEIIDLGIIPDREADLRAALQGATQAADLVLTSGGISVGEADHMRKLIFEGKVLFSKVAIKPGRPITLARWQESWLFALPGNPVAAMTTFYQFVRPAIRRLQGEPSTPPLRFRVRCTQTLRKSPGRTEFQRGLLDQDENGELRVAAAGRQGSGILTSMSLGNCFILLEEPLGPIAAGDWVTVEPFPMLRFPT